MCLRLWTIWSFLVAASSNWYCVASPRPLHSRLATPTAKQQVRRWRVNDTLVVEFSHPQGTFKTPSNKSSTLWGRAVLRGQRGYSWLLEPGLLYTLYGVAVAPRGGAIRVAGFWPGEDGKKLSRLPKPVQLFPDDFIYRVWDIKYHTLAWYVSADLRELDTRDDGFGFVGGPWEEGVYYLLPHWLAQEQARLARTHRLPPTKQLAAYLEACSPDGKQVGWIINPPPYRSLMVKLLHAYQAYPMPPATARRLVKTLHLLAPPKRSKHHLLKQS